MQRRSNESNGTQFTRFQWLYERPFLFISSVFVVVLAILAFQNWQFQTKLAETQIQSVAVVSALTTVLVTLFALALLGLVLNQLRRTTVEARRLADEAIQAKDEAERADQAKFGQGAERKPAGQTADEIKTDVERATQDSAASDEDPDPPLVDTEQLACLCDAIGEQNFRKLLGSVPDECNALLGEIRNALAAGDLEAARVAAHCMRGMAGNFAAERIAAIAGQIEVEAQTIEEAEGKTGKLETAIEKTRCWIAAVTRKKTRFGHAPMPRGGRRLPMAIQDMKVLVVDDSKDMCGLIRAILRGFGINHVDEASNGIDGFDKFCDLRPDVVITDLNMRPMDGLELVRVIRNEAPGPDRNVPVIVLSGNADRRHIDKACEAGATHFLAKPIAPDTLRARLESLAGYK